MATNAEEEANPAPGAAPGTAGPARGGPGPARAIPTSWLLALAAAAPFLPVLGHGFVRWDDDQNFFRNFDFGALGWDRLRWAWTTFLLGVYQPLAWTLLEAECSLWGLEPRGYHAVSLLLHAANAVALYALLVDLLGRLSGCESGPDRTGATRAAGLAALLFAVHPLRVEAVAWASCQPYLPAILCALLATRAYLRAHPESGPIRRSRLLAAWLLTVSAMLFKAVAVSLPALFLILDACPLRRLGPGRWLDRRVWVEKLPFAVPAMVVMGVALRAKADYGSLTPLGEYGVASRVAQACYAAVFYLVKTAWPAGLSAYYPLPDRVELRAWPYWGAALAIAAASLGAVRLARRWPGLLAAWAAYLTILAPNLGLAKIGHQIAADRYSYLASVPLAALLAVGACRLLRRPGGRRAVIVAGLGASALLGALSWRQCRTWRTSEALWSNALARTDVPSDVILANLGWSEYEVDKVAQGIRRYREAMRLDPRNPVAHFGVGMGLVEQGRIEESLAAFREALRIKPDYAEVSYNLGMTLARQGRLVEAEAQLALASRRFPRDPNLHYALGVVFSDLDRLDEAEARFRESLRLRPDRADAHYNLGAVLASRGRLDEAAASYERALRLRPEDPEAHNNLGAVLLDQGKYSQAEARFREALRLRPGYQRARLGLDAARRKLDPGAAVR